MLYDISSLETYKKIIKKGIIKMIVSFLITILFLVILALFTNYNTKENIVTIFKIASIILLVSMGWYELYILIDTVFLYNNKIKILEAINNTKINEYEGTILDIKKPITISKYEKSYVITIKTTKNTLSCYYSKQFNNMPLKVNKNYLFSIANNIIVDYKEQN